MRWHSVSRTILSTLLVSILTACGGSSGTPASDEPDPTVLVGTYFHISLSAHYETEGSGEPVVSASYGTATSDGHGTFTTDGESTRTYTGDPVAEPPGGARPVPYAYEEDEAGNITFSVTQADTVLVVGRGVVSPDGAIAILSSLPPFSPSLSLFLRQDDAYSTDSFTGDHQFVAWTTRSDGGTNTTSSGEASLSAPDTLELTFEEENKEGEARPRGGCTSRRVGDLRRGQPRHVARCRYLQPRLQRRRRRRRNCPGLRRLSPAGPGAGTLGPPPRGDRPDPVVL